MWSVLGFSLVVGGVADTLRGSLFALRDGFDHLRQEGVVSDAVALYEKKDRCYRIPTLLLTSKKTLLLAFAENRSLDCADTSDHTLVVRRSSDLGETWGEEMTVYRPTSTPCDGCPMAVSNPNPVEVTFPNGTKAILLHFDTKNNPQPEAHGRDCQIWSYDDGKTWTQNAEVLEYPPVENNGGLIGPSVGVFMNNIIYYSTRFDGTTNLYYSKDFGTSWDGVQYGIRGVDECSIAPMTDQRILFNCRTTEHKRAQIIFDHSNDLVEPVPVGDLTYPDGLIDANCQGSIVHSDGRYFLSNTNTTGPRKNLTVKTSKDDGTSWNAGVLITDSDSAYSQLAPLSENDDATLLGLVFENGGGSPYDRISFVTVSIPK